MSACKIENESEILMHLLKVSNTAEQFSFDG